MQRIPERAFLHGLGVAFGLAYLTTSPNAAVRAAVPGWVIPLQAVTLLLGGLLGLFAFLASVRRPSMALFSEWIALRAQAAAVVVVLSSTFVVWWARPDPQPFPFLGVAFFGLWLGIHLWRERQVASLIKPLTKRAARNATRENDHA